MRANCTLILAALLLLPVLASAQKRANYDEAKVPPYEIPDPLLRADGTLVATAAEWPARRAEILATFQREMYGQLPPACPIFTETVSLDESGDFSVRKVVRMWFRPDRSGPCVDWTVVTPKAACRPTPCVLLLNYKGLDDKTFGELIPVDMLVARGYSLVTATYTDISPDPVGKEAQDQYAYTGIFDLWGPRDPSRTDNTTSLMAWAWALMRAMDMIAAEPAIDESRVVLTGYSRLAKAALVAGAFDDRFAVVAPVQTGGGGVPIAKRYFGENVQTETAAFTHWFCRAYDKYADNEASLPFDQHFLLACVAPRPLLVCGFDKDWFDTKGEFLSVRAASPVWELLGKPGLPDVSWPADFDTKAIGPCLGYVRRSGAHFISHYDWEWILDFADANLRCGCCAKPAFRPQIGLCGGIGRPEDLLLKAGVDYCEAGVSGNLKPLEPEENFKPFKDAARRSCLPLVSANGFFPGEIRLVGPEADIEEAMAYVRVAFERAGQLGIKTVVLGSGGARRIPDGYSRKKATKQFVALCKAIGPVAEAHGIVVAIEPLRTQETNFINSVREGLEIVRATDHPCIKVLADFYHMTQVGEGPDAIIEAGSDLAHCHIAENARRTAPGVDGDDFTPYLQALKDIGYKGGISLECGWSDFDAQIIPAVAEIRKQISTLK